MNADVADIQMIRIQYFRRLGLVKTVKLDAGVSHDKRIAAQVERRCVGGVFRGQRVEGKLEIRLAQRVALVKDAMHTEHLACGNRYLALS